MKIDNSACTTVDTKQRFTLGGVFAYLSLLKFSVRMRQKLSVLGQYIYIFLDLNGFH